MTPLKHQPDPRLDLSFERVIDVPRELVWKAWTSPEHLETTVKTSASWAIRQVPARCGGTVMTSPLFRLWERFSSELP